MTDELMLRFVNEAGAVIGCPAEFTGTWKESGVTWELLLYPASSNVKNVFRGKSPAQCLMRCRKELA
jgi:hypothetical protein